MVHSLIAHSLMNRFQQVGKDRSNLREQVTGEHGASMFFKSTMTTLARDYTAAVCGEE